MNDWKGVLAAAALLAATPARICVGSGYEWGGLGARHLARGGAAVADSDDWTAVYWNPGNIVRAARRHGFEAGLEVFGGISAAKDTDSLSSLPGIGAIFNERYTSSPFILGALGIVFPLGERAAFATALYTPLGQGSDFHDTSVNAAGTILDQTGSAGIVTWGTAASIAILDNLSAGAGLNVLYGTIQDQTTLRNPPPAWAAFGSPITSQKQGDGFGLEGIFGLRYDPHPRLSFGAGYRMGADIPIEGDAHAFSPNAGEEASPFKFSLRHPPTVDLGLAYRPSGDWTFTFDSHQTFWSRFSNETTYERPGNLLSNSANSFDWRHTWRLRAGAAYRLSPKTELLGGYTYDRHALDPGSVDMSTSIEANLHNISGGIARKFGKGFELILGGIGGTGKRSEGGVDYRFTGFQLMAEARVGL